MDSNTTKGLESERERERERERGWREERNPDYSLTRNHSFTRNVINAALSEISETALAIAKSKRTRNALKHRYREVIARLNIVPCMRARVRARYQGVRLQKGEFPVREGRWGGSRGP